VLACTVFFFCRPAIGQVAVQHTEGLVHGSLVLRTLEGETLAHEDLVIAPTKGPSTAAWERESTELWWKLLKSERNRRAAKRIEAPT
jgi:hypothetical protein